MEARTPPNEALADYQRRNCGGCEHADAELVGTGEPCCNRTWQDCEHRRRQHEACEAEATGTIPTSLDVLPMDADHDQRNDEAAAKWKAEREPCWKCGRAHGEGDEHCPPGEK
ncbi:hypothetical protein LCGC14_0825000 [marine sediment metagenome]|uniref:Uncharacterized protein n=1 Tax=marine sediment metagenome TaxID=412755 RepID=A0A0F9PMG5_9ZZZZ